MESSVGKRRIGAKGYWSKPYRGIRGDHIVSFSKTVDGTQPSIDDVHSEVEQFYFILYSENQCISKLDKIGIFTDMQFL